MRRKESSNNTLNILASLAGALRCCRTLAGNDHAARPAPCIASRQRAHNRPTYYRSTPKGFTLLETLVALAIIGIAMAAAMRSTRFAIDTVGDLKTRTAATWVAQNVSNQLLASQLFPEPGASSGNAVQGMQEFVWLQEVTVTPNYSFRRVEIKVFVPERPEHVVSRQVSYVARRQN